MAAARLAGTEPDTSTTMRAVILNIGAGTAATLPPIRTFFSAVAAVQRVVLDVGANAIATLPPGWTFFSAVAAVQWVALKVCTRRASRRVAARPARFAAAGSACRSTDFTAAQAGYALGTAISAALFAALPAVIVVGEVVHTVPIVEWDLLRTASLILDQAVIRATPAIHILGEVDAFAPAAVPSLGARDTTFATVRRF